MTSFKIELCVYTTSSCVYDGCWIDYGSIFGGFWGQKSIQNRSNNHHIRNSMSAIRKVQFWMTSSVFWLVLVLAWAWKFNENRIRYLLKSVLLSWSIASSIFYRFWVHFWNHLGSLGAGFGSKNERPIQRPLHSESLWSQSLLRRASATSSGTIFGSIFVLPRFIFQ